MPHGMYSTIHLLEIMHLSAFKSPLFYPSSQSYLSLVGGGGRGEILTNCAEKALSWHLASPPYIFLHFKLLPLNFVRAQIERSVGDFLSQVRIRIEGFLKGSLTRDFPIQVFFMNLCSSGPLSIPQGPFRIFTKIRGDIRNFVFITGVVSCSPVSTT